MVMTPQEITNELSTFTGTESYHRINPLTPNVVENSQFYIVWEAWKRGDGE